MAKVPSIIEFTSTVVGFVFAGEVPEFEEDSFGRTRVEVHGSDELEKGTKIRTNANYGPDAVTTREERSAHGVYLEMSNHDAWRGDGGKTTMVFDSLSVDEARKLAMGLMRVADEVERA